MKKCFKATQQQTIWAPIVSGMSHGRSRVSHPYSASERASKNISIYVLIRSARAHLESAPERGGWERRFKGRKWQLRKVQNVWDGAGKSSGAARRVFLPPRSWDLRLVSLRAHLLAHNTRKGHGSPAAAAKFALNSAGFGCDSAASRDENQQVNTHSLTLLRQERGAGEGRGASRASCSAAAPPCWGSAWAPPTSLTANVNTTNTNFMLSQFYVIASHDSIY